MNLKTWIQRIIDTSVFRRMPPNTAMGDILAVLFHRSSATLYFLYCVWAGVSIGTGIPSLITFQGQQWQIIFSIVVLIFASPACFGATFWPNYARLELYSGAAFISLLGLYVIYLTLNALFAGGAWSGVVLALSTIVIPTSRVIVVAVFLLEQARERRAAIAAHLAGVES